MIIIKEKDCVYFASPLKYHNSCAQVDSDYNFEENGDMWHLNDGNGTVVAVKANNSRVLDVLRYSDAFSGEFSMEGMAQIRENIKRVIRKSECTPSDPAISFCIARGTDGYVVSIAGSVFEINSIEVLGEKTERVLATYDVCKDIPDICERVATVYHKIEGGSDYKYLPVALISTKDDSYTLLK